MEMWWAYVAIAVMLVLAAIGFLTVLNWLFEWRVCRDNVGVRVHRFGCWQHS